VIYLDNNATTRVLPEVLKALLPFYQEMWGNPSGLYPFAAQVAKHISQARENVAALLRSQRESEIIFTSGGTESNNLAIRGVLQSNPDKRHIITTQVEHPSVLMLCRQLEKENYTVTYLSDPAELEKAIRPDTGLISIMWANNETGVLFPIEKIAGLCLAKNILLHVDATQAVGKIAIDLCKVPVSLLSLSGHKFHAPKGIGALYVRRGIKLLPLVYGGGQERGRRSGTENVAGIVGLGEAARLAKKRLDDGVLENVKALRDRLEQQIVKNFSGTKINSQGSPRVPNTSSIAFNGLEGESLSLLLGEEEICVSTGSACSAGALEPSHVLKAMGCDSKQARGTIRFSLSCETTSQEIDQTLAALEKITKRLHG